MPLSTVSGILARIGMGRLGRLGLEPAVRYERSRPGELVHIDVKKLGRVAGAGHRVTGDRASQYDRRGRRARGELGWEYVQSPSTTTAASPMPSTRRRESDHSDRLPPPRTRFLRPLRNPGRTRVDRQL